MPKARQRRLQDVQLSLATDARRGAAHVCVAEGHVALIDVEAIERPAVRANGTVHLAAPVDGKWLAIQRSQEIEVEWLGGHLHVLHGEHRTADGERHVANEVRSGARDIHIGELVIDDAQILRLVADVDRGLAATCGW